MNQSLHQPQQPMPGSFSESDPLPAERTPETLIHADPQASSSEVLAAREAVRLAQGEQLVHPENAKVVENKQQQYVDTLHTEAQSAAHTSSEITKIPEAVEVFVDARAAAQEITAARLSEVYRDLQGGSHALAA